MSLLITGRLPASDHRSVTGFGPRLSVKHPVSPNGSAVRREDDLAE
jgi:hypothetical protein